MITIITPTYNSKYFIDLQYQRLRPILSDNIKWLIIDDASEDNTEELIKKFMCPYVKCYKLKKNGGPSKARHIGAKIAESDYIFFLDADDVLLNSNFIQFIEYIKQNTSADISYYYAPTYTSNTMPTESEMVLYNNITCINKPTDFIFNDMPNYSSLAVNRLYFINKVKENDLEWGEDIVSYLQLSNYGVGQKWKMPVSCYIITGEGRGSALSIKKRLNLFSELVKTSIYAPNKISSFCFSFFLIARYTLSYFYKKIRG
ncbi:TPA: glycosyltransferase family 2 protein [Escherichia coli]|uniref:glycosyltransferase family 2 protein n=1 Tax=Escherichia coli TaxID=562 RepID=UPI001481DCAF|nr:glycosyltransferase family A protein [Escherichia coli]EFC6642472.1 glycosyltransferase family 2 protein [Escherichia coli]EIA1389483.1 glycosyltransferase family 2 protein [Escherichia coli]MBH9627056.1 glycosyltransferase family 2 protein [Escherichia coli]MCV5068305.1 glycosyltransferase family 2 protein [Escherichia coli]MCV5273647.1 glycosyltransferase family 2 protein [Escherichia coli]